MQTVHDASKFSNKSAVCTHRLLQSEMQTEHDASKFTNKKCKRRTTRTRSHSQVVPSSLLMTYAEPCSLYPASSYRLAALPT